jgi:cytochrome c-type biogenesis protein CcmH/NrfG
VGLRIAFVAFAGVTAVCLGAAPAGYVDSKVCARCHREIAEAYARTGMGRSFVRPAASNTVEDYDSAAARDFYHAPSDTHFAMLRRGSEYFQRRWQTGLDGRIVNVEELKVDYVMGSGNHARSYLHRTARGTLIELPFGWYAEGARWDMSPGSDSDRPRTRRFVSYKCMFCHNAVPQIPAGYDAPGSDPVYEGDLPEGIDCQRCHGPGERHVRTVTTAGGTPEAVRASIVNPARLSPERRNEVCMQCHLETTSGPIPSWVVRFDRGPFSFRPGEPLGDFAIAFDHAPGAGHDAKFEAVSSVYRLRQSNCFRRSEGGLACDTCHDPHRVPRGAEAVAHYSAACRQCHAQVVAAQHPPSDDCAGCHMPKRRAEDTPGMVMTDHRIARRPPPGNPVAAFREHAPEEYRGPVVPYYPDPLPATPVNALYRAIAQVGLGNNTERGMPDLVREIAAQKPNNSEFYMVLGDGWLALGKAREAIDAYRQAARLSPASPRPLRSLAEALRRDGQAPAAAEVLKRALALAPRDAVTWDQAGMLDLDAEKVRKAIELDPSLPGQSRTLAEILDRAGQPDAALAAARDALRSDPYDAMAWDFAGRALAAKGEWRESFFDFERAVRLRPHDATCSYDFALALVRGDRFDEAQTRAEAAIAADPAFADAYELLGGLYLRNRRLADAVRAYRRMVELRPDSPRARLRLGNALAAQGDLAAAAEELRRAAAGSDSAVAAQAAEALRRIGAR